MTKKQRLYGWMVMWLTAKETMRQYEKCFGQAEIEVKNIARIMDSIEKDVMGDLNERERSLRSSRPKTKDTR